MTNGLTFEKDEIATPIPVPGSAFFSGRHPVPPINFIPIIDPSLMMPDAVARFPHGKQRGHTKGQNRQNRPVKGVNPDTSYTPASSVMERKSQVRGIRRRKETIDRSAPFRYRRTWSSLLGRSRNGCNGCIDVLDRKPLPAAQARKQIACALASAGMTVNAA